MTDHDRVGKEVVDSILKKFKQGEWECNGNMGKDFYRTATEKTHPSPDHAFGDDENKIMVTFEYKPQTESKRGVLTGLGQSIAYLNKSDISFLVIPKKLDDGYNIEAQMTEIFERQILGQLPVGLIVFDNNNPSEVRMIQNVDSLLGKDSGTHMKHSGRFYAKHVDLPIPLFHLILHFYYLKKFHGNTGDPLANCWKERMWSEKSLQTCKPVVVRDVHNEIIMTPAGRKEFSVMDDYLAKIQNSRGATKQTAIDNTKMQARTDLTQNNHYRRVMTKNFLPFLTHLGVVAGGELTSYGVKLYHLGLTNGPNSRIFRDYFLKAILEQGRHLEVIFDLERLCKEYRGRKTTKEIETMMKKEYMDKGMVKENANRRVGKNSKTTFLKYEFILWNSLQIKEKTTGKPELAFNWEKITEIRALPEL